MISCTIFRIPIPIDRNYNDNDNDANQILTNSKNSKLNKCTTLEDATELAIKKAQKSNLKEIVILLSPSAASFDQFINFEDRGNKFKEIVNKQLNEGDLIC